LKILLFCGLTGFHHSIKLRRFFIVAVISEGCGGFGGCSFAEQAKPQHAFRNLNDFDVGKLLAPPAVSTFRRRGKLRLNNVG
jgi:hypothetical protein